jgi:two-component system response regulator GlrR
MVMAESMGQAAPSLEAIGVERPVGRRREDRIVGASRATQRVIEQATAAARTDLPVLVSGPSGSGKEFVARAVHAWGARSARPFLVVACGSIPESLQAREILGCVAGQHPVIPELHVGLLERAADGTVLLDGIELLRADLRSALLEALAQGSFRPEGSPQAVPLRVRLIATTERPASPSPFLDVPHHTIAIAPLVERREDILPLAAHFLAASAAEVGTKPVGFTADARELLLSELWPGNVRELRVRIHQAVRLAAGGAVTAEALLLATEDQEIPSFKDAKRAFETRYVISLLRRCGGNISRAARLARKDRKDFYDVIRRTGIDPANFRS